VKAEKSNRDCRKYEGATLRRMFSVLLCVAGAGLLAQAAVAQSGQMTIIAGSTAPPTGTCVPAITPTPLCNAGYTGDNGPAIQANLFFPMGVAFDPKNGMVYVADGVNGAIRRIDNGGYITTYQVLPGGGDLGNIATAVTVDTSGNVYYGDDNGTVYKNGAVVQPVYTNTQIEALTTDAQGNLYVIVTTQGSQYQLYENGRLLAATGSTPGIPSLSDKLFGLAVSCTGSACNVYSIDPNYTGGLTSAPTTSILQFVITTTGGVPNLSSLTYVAQSPGTSAVPGQSLAIDGAGNFYINEGSAIVQYTPGAASSVALAGSGTPGFNGNANSDCTPIQGGGVPLNCYNVGGVPLPPTATDINGVAAIFVTPGGALYIADTKNNLVRRESSSTETGCQECGPTTLSLSDQLPVISYGFAINPVTQELYVPLASATPSGNGVVNVYNAAYPGTDTLIASIPVGPSPGQVVIDSANNLVYVPNGDSTVSVINGGVPGQSLPILNAKVTVSGGAGPMAVDPTLMKAYVITSNGASVSVVGPPVGGVFPSAATTVSTSTFSAFNSLSALAVDTNVEPNGTPAMRKNLVYARCFCLGTSLTADENYSMAIIDATTDTVTNEVSAFISGSTTVYPDSLAVDQTTGNVVMADAGDQSLHIWSYADQAFLSPYNPNPSFYPNHVVTDSNNQITYFTDGYGNSASLNLTTFLGYSLSQATNVENTCGAYSNVIAVDPSTDQAYMTTCPVTGLAVINGGDAQVTSALLSLIDGPSGSIITTFLLPTSGTDTAGSSPSNLLGPFAIAENPLTQVVYVGNSVSNTINVINGFAPAARPYLTFSANPLIFPSSTLGTTPTATLTVTNNCSPPNGLNVIGICGGGVAPIPSLAATVVNAQGGSGTVTPQGCTVSPLAVFGSCQYLVTFTPTGSTFSGSILFTDNALNTPQTVNFSGTYGLAATPQFSPPALNFGPVPENVNVGLSITVTNPAGTGNVPLTISNISFAAGSSPDFRESSDCSTGILPGASCTIGVEYSPTIYSSTNSAANQETATLVVTDNAEGGGQQTILVNGTSAAPNQGYATFSSTSVNLGNIEYNEPGVTPPIQSAPQTITLTNSGSASLTISSIQSSNPTDFLVSDTCPRAPATPLAVFSSCTIYVSFAPTMPVGTLETAQVIINDSSPAGSQTIQVSGTSSAPLLGPSVLPELVSSDNSVPAKQGVFPNGGILEPAITASLNSGGQFIAFSAGVSNFPGPFETPYGPMPELYLRNTCLGAGSNCEQGTTFIAYGPAAGSGANGGAACGPGTGPTGYRAGLGSQFPAMDTTGEYVAFTSDACQFSTITSSNANQLYLRDLSAGTTTLVSLDSTPPGPVSLGLATFSLLSESTSPFSMSTDPKALAFAYETASPNVVAGVTTPSGENEIYWTNVCTAQSPSACTTSTVLVSQDGSNSNVAANNTAEAPAISPDGRYVAFTSNATNLVGGVPANSTQVYLRDTCPTGATGCTGTTLVSTGTTASGVSNSPSVASGGRFVVFVSSDKSLIPSGVTSSTQPQIYLRDTQSRTTTLLSQVTTSGITSAGNGASSSPFISADGRLITFTSNSSNLNSGNPTNLALFEYDTCQANGVTVAAPCSGGLSVLSNQSSTSGSSGGSPAAVDASDQFVAYDVFANTAGYPFSEAYVGRTTVVPPPPSPTTMVFTLAPGSTATFGQSIILTATVTLTSSGAPATNGAVTFYDQNGQLAVVNLNGAGQAIYGPPGLLPGPYSFAANYGGTSAFGASGGTAVLIVTRAASATVLTPSASSIVAGLPLTLTAVVSIPGGTVAPTGNITFLNGSTPLGQGTTTASSAGSLTQTFTTPIPDVGSYTFNASYPGDSNYTNSNSNSVPVTVTVALAPAVVNVTERIGLTDTPSSADVFDPELVSLTDMVFVTAMSPTTTMLGSSGDPTDFGQSVTFTATVTSAGGTPTGTMIFSDGTTSLGSSTLSAAGVATLTTSALGAGNHVITAIYAGNANFVGSEATLTQTVSKAATNIVLATSPNPTVVGQSVTLTATISVTFAGTGTPTGTVTFLDGTTTLDVGTLAAGVATYSTNTLAVGSHSLTAAYSGDPDDAGSTSAGVSQLVNKAATSIVVSSSANPSAFGETVTFTAAVSAVSPGTGTPLGTVSFSDGTTSLGTITLSSTGFARLATSSLATGDHSITANYSGDPNFNPSEGAATQTVTKANTSLQLQSATGTGFVTLTATLSAGASGLPTGSVTFSYPLSGVTTTLGTVALASSGTQPPSAVAALPTSSLAFGTDTVTATYAGDPNFAGSSASTAVTPDFSIGASVSTITLSAGQSSPQITVTATSPTGFASQIALSCGSLPVYVHCLFTPPLVPATVPTSATTATSILVVSVDSTNAVLEQQGRIAFASAAPFGLLGVMGLLFARRKRRIFYAGVLLLFAGIVGTITGCSSSATTASNLPPAGNQTVVVNATANGVVHPLNLTVDITN
jgi:sugar lactone lactonase YvrE